MLNVKKLLTQILSMLYVSQTQTFTACGKNWGFRRIGKVVYVDAPSDITSTTSGWNSIGTLQTGLRPLSTKRIRPANRTDAMYMDIATTGVVRLYCPSAITSANNCALSSSYIAQ